MLEEAADELLGRDRATLELGGGRLFVGESDLTILELPHAVVADGHAEDVRSEILEGLRAGAHRLGMDHPVFTPDAGCDLSEERSLAQGITKLGAEDAGERFDGHEKVRAGRTPAAVVSEAAAGDYVM